MNIQDATKIKSAARKLEKIHPVLAKELKEIIDRNYNAAPTLQDIFDAQIDFNNRVVPGMYDLEKIYGDDIKKDHILSFNMAMQQEQAELIDSLDWKWWKSGENDWDNAKIELIDILHFWVSMCTVLGMNANDVMDMYFKKNKLNQKRLAFGYKEGTYQKVVDGVEDNVRDVTNG